MTITLNDISVLLTDFGKDLREDIRKDVREDTVEIVGQAIEEFSRLMDVKFDKMESKFHKRFSEIDEKIEVKTKELSHQISGVNNRLDMHLLDCVKRDEHKKLEKRVGKLEKMEKTEAFA